MGKPIKAVLCAVCAFSLAPPTCLFAQVTAEQLPSTYFPTKMICADSPFVAMVRLGPARLVLIRIGRNGIEKPQTLLLSNYVVSGMKCGYRRVELLIRDGASDHFSKLPFTILDDAIRQGEAQEIDYSISGKGPTPPEIDDFREITMALYGTRGDWRVHVPSVPIKGLCELHFVRTETRSRNGLTTRFTVTLEELTNDGKLIKSLPLIKEKTFEAAD